MQGPRFHVAEALDRDGAARSEGECIPKQCGGSGGEVDGVERGAAFHAAGGVHGVAPEVVGEFVAANDTGGERAAVEAGAEVEIETTDVADTVQRFVHAEREHGGGGRVIGARHGHAGNYHVGVADCLYLLEAQHSGEFVEPCEDVVEQTHERQRRHGARERREPDEVGEEHGRTVEVVGDHGLAALEAVGDGLREDVAEESF